MRVAGFGLLGFLGGAMAGFLLALLCMILWYDVLAMGPEGGDGMSGLGTFMLLAPLLALIGGVAGAILFARRAQSGKSASFVIAMVLLVFVLFLAALFLFGL